jgi:hypothetical protein
MPVGILILARMADHAAAAVRDADEEALEAVKKRQ